MFTIATVLWTFVTVLSLFADIASSACSISITDDQLSPLLIENTTGTPTFVLPINSTTILINEGSSIEVYCSQATIKVDSVPMTKSLLIYCENGKFHCLDTGANISFSSIKCNEEIKGVPRYTGINCLTRYSEFEIGYSYKNYFISIIRGCFDETYQITLYTASVIPNIINAAVQGRERKCWTISTFYKGTNVNRIYTKENQARSINKQLGLLPNSTRYIEQDTSATMYLAHGHLTPKTDFIYGPHQDATFFCMNAVPQWQTLNAGNWKRIEQHVKDLAARTEVGLKIYTGIWEILSLEHSSPPHNLTQLYMHVDNQGMKMPIPRYIWKIAYDEALNAGIAFVGVNNPYANNVTALRFCEDVCDQANVILNHSNYTRYGYVFCCTVDSLLDVVKTVPDEVPKGFILLTGIPANRT